MRLLFTTIAVFLFLCVLIGAGIAWVGRRAPVEFQVEMSADIKARPEIVWAALTNISTLPDRDDDISEVELLEADQEGPLRWKVVRGETSVMIYRRQVAEPYQRLVLVIDGGNMGIEGSFRYDLRPTDQGTSLTVVEQSQVQDLMLRAAFALAGGRDQVLRAQLTEIKEVSEAQ